MQFFAKRAKLPPELRWIATALTLGVVALLAYLDHALWPHATHTFLVANSFEVVDWLTMEALDVLTNQLSCASHFSTAFQEDFEREFAPGDTVRVPLPFKFQIRNGLAYQGQSLQAKHTTVSCDQIFGVDFDIDSVERALRVGRTREWVSDRLIRPAMAQIAQEYDSRAALFAYQNSPNIVGVLGTDPTDFDSSSAAARQYLVEMACPKGERGILVPPSVMRALKKSAISYFNPVSDISKQYRTGIVGSGDGMEWYESMSLYSHTSGTWTSPTGMTVKTASVSGDTSLVINCTTGDTFNQGDVFSITGRYRVNPATRRAFTNKTFQFVVTAATTGASSAATLQIYPPLIGAPDPYQTIDSLPQVNDVLTPFTGATFTASTPKSGTQALILNEGAYMIVGVPLELPKKGAEVAQQYRDPETGFSVRYTKTWDAINSRMISRFDTLFGFGIGYPESCSVRLQCA